MRIKVIKDEVIYDGRFIQTIRRHFLDLKGNPKTWEMVSRKTYGRIVAIAALTPERELILEKIYRVPLQDYTLELPAGLMDREGEPEVETIRRELLEETGYKAEDIKLLYAGPFNSGMLNDEMAVYFGLNAKFVQEPRFEDSEDIEVVKVPVKNLIDYLEEKGKIMKVDIKIAALLPYLERRGLMI
ncbi:MAG: NUDIX hydrolase [Parcubacteria group bacterium]|nr:NUDIX hydrolase [Parcubacteria group bacterium]